MNSRDREATRRAWWIMVLWGFLTLTFLVAYDKDQDAFTLVVAAFQGINCLIWAATWWSER